MQHVTIASPHYHTRYYTFSLSLAPKLFATGYHALPSNIYKKMYINIIFEKWTITRGHPLQIASKPC